MIFSFDKTFIEQRGIQECYDLAQEWQDAGDRLAVYGDRRHLQLGWMNFTQNRACTYRLSEAKARRLRETDHLTGKVKDHAIYVGQLVDKYNNGPMYLPYIDKETGKTSVKRYDLVESEFIPGERQVKES